MQTLRQKKSRRQSVKNRMNSLMKQKTERFRLMTSSTHQRKICGQHGRMLLVIPMVLQIMQRLWIKVFRGWVVVMLGLKSPGWL